MSLGYGIIERSEFFADKYALKLIGKEKCLAALSLIKSQNVNSKKSGTIYNIFFKVVPIEKKVEFLNEYREKN